jgi:hypothetical protein
MFYFILKKIKKKKKKKKKYVKVANHPIGFFLWNFFFEAVNLNVSLSNPKIGENQMP